MEPVTSKLFANATSLSALQQETSRIAMIVAHSVWAAARAHPGQAFPGLRLQHYCVLATLIAVDVMHGLGWRRAVPLKCGLDVRGVAGRRHYQLTCGSPDAQQHPDLLNGHVVPLIDDVIVDLTLGQTRRPWNEVPTIGVFVAAPDEHRSIDILPDCRVPVIAGGHMFSLRGGVQLSYFKLPPSVEHATRNWMDLPDAPPCRRRKIVEAALAIARSRLAETEPLAA